MDSTSTASLVTTKFFLSTIPMGGERSSASARPTVNATKYQFVNTQSTSSLEASAWESTWVSKGLLKGRLFFSSSKGYPAGVFSTLPFSSAPRLTTMAAGVAASDDLGVISAQLKKSRDRSRSPYQRAWRTLCGGNGSDGGSDDGGDDYDERGDPNAVAAVEGVSYERHLHCERAPCLFCAWAQRNGRVAHPPPPPWYPYDANELDDPGINTNLSNLDHTVLSLPSYRMSVVPHADARELKTQLNEQFRVTHPNLAHMHASRTKQKGQGRKVLTLSKIRRLKRESLQLACRADLDVELSTIALSHVYFEKLVFAKRVSAGNRRVVMACCVLLAHKFNHTSMPDRESTLQKQRDLLEALESYPKGAPRRQILEAEPDILSALRFTLHVPRKEVMPHFYRLLDMMKPLTTAREYLGDAMFQRLRRRRNVKATISSSAAAAASSSKPLRSRRLKRSLQRQRRRRERRRQREHQQSRRAALVEEKLRRMDARALKEHYKFLKQERKLVLAELSAVQEQLDGQAARALH